MNTHKYRTLYRIDRDHQIVSVANNWNAFTPDIEGTPLASEPIAGHSLWEFITDHDTREIYRQMIWRAFAGRSMKFDIRCDTPEQRRSAKLSIHPGEDGDIEIEVYTTRVTDRPPQELLRRHEPSAAGTVMECSFCNKIQTGPSSWDEVETAVAKLHLYGRPELPDLTHGVCGDCHDKLEAELAACLSMDFGQTEH